MNRHYSGSNRFTLPIVASAVCALLSAFAAGAENPSTKIATGNEGQVATGQYLVIDLTSRTIVVGEAKDEFTPPPTMKGFVVSNLVAAPVGGWTDEYKTTKLVLRRIPAGTFTMGSPTNELGRNADEARHKVTLTGDFYIGVFEVTQKQWERVMGTRPRYFTTPTRSDVRPVEQISYYEIRERSAPPVPCDDPAVDWPSNNAVNAESFMGRLRAKTGLTTLDLPTEAQWEYACRAGTTTGLSSAKDLTDARECPNMASVGRYFNNVDSSEVGRFPDNHGGSKAGCTEGRYTLVGTAVVGSYLPNGWGLYDMHGNVWEWCLDWYAETYPGAVTDPSGPESGTRRVLRGGSWQDLAWCCRSANRGAGGVPAYRNGGFGFRVAMTAPRGEGRTAR